MNRAMLGGLILLMATACGGQPAAEKSNNGSAAEDLTSTEASSSPEENNTPSEPAAPPAVQAEAAQISPEKAFRPCAVCHSVADPATPKGKIRLAGPNLFGIYGAKAGRLENFSYSKALLESGVVWDDASLDGYIEKPSTFIRGNRMAYVGKRKPEKRAAIIAYLKEQK